MYWMPGKSPRETPSFRKATTRRPGSIIAESIFTFPQPEANPQANAITIALGYVKRSVISDPWSTHCPMGTAYQYAHAINAIWIGSRIASMSGGILMPAPPLVKW